jgi:hypothetical protein
VAQLHRAAERCGTGHVALLVGAVLAGVEHREAHKVAVCETIGRWCSQGRREGQAAARRVRNASTSSSCLDTSPTWSLAISWSSHVMTHGTKAWAVSWRSVSPWKSARTARGTARPSRTPARSGGHGRRRTYPPLAYMSRNRLRAAIDPAVGQRSRNVWVSESRIVFHSTSYLFVHLLFVRGDFIACFDSVLSLSSFQ